MPGRCGPTPRCSWDCWSSSCCSSPVSHLRAGTRPRTYRRGTVADSILGRPEGIHLLVGPHDRGPEPGCRPAEAGSPAHGAQPGDVRRLGGRAGSPRCWRPSTRRCSGGRSPAGCGRRCCSPRSPKRSPKAAAEHRRTSLRRARTDTPARVLRTDGTEVQVAGSALRVGDIVVAGRGGDPGDGDVVRGIASVDEVGHHRRVGTGDPRVRW